MAHYYRHPCGHTSLYSLAGQGERPCSDPCHACRMARVGETICFARHGVPPVSGTSRNHREHTAEAGVSVYEIVDGAIQYTGWWFEIAKRPLYRGKGTIVGWGSDGEPLVQIHTIRSVRPGTSTPEATA